VQEVHCESTGLLQVSALVQLAISVHSGHADASPCVVRKRPDSHAVHCESKAVEHLTSDTHASTVEHSTQAFGTLEVSSQ